jgi:hypothetical protein
VYKRHFWDKASKNGNFAEIFINQTHGSPLRDLHGMCINPGTYVNNTEER